MAQCPDGQIGGFRLLRLLGQGGMGEVWLADHPRLPRQVAVKVLRAGTADNPESRERFLREAETVARLEHPAIVDVFDRGEERGRLWIAMRFVDGEDLGSLLRREGALQSDRALSIATPVADALDHAHDRGIIHRDVKPANILLPGSGLPAAVVTDFGIARAVDDDRSMTGTGLVVGRCPISRPNRSTVNRRRRGAICTDSPVPSTKCSPGDGPSTVRQHLRSSALTWRRIVLVYLAHGPIYRPQQTRSSSVRSPLILLPDKRAQPSSSLSCATHSTSLSSLTYAPIAPPPLRLPPSSDPPRRSPLPRRLR